MKTILFCFFFIISLVSLSRSFFPDLNCQPLMCPAINCKKFQTVSLDWRGCLVSCPTCKEENQVKSDYAKIGFVPKCPTLMCLRPTRFCEPGETIQDINPRTGCASCSKCIPLDEVFSDFGFVMRPRCPVNMCVRAKRYCRVGEHHQKQNPRTGCWACPHCIPREKKCRNTRCKLYCRYGFRRRNGCTICSCNPKPITTKCPPRRCPMYYQICKYGAYYPVDKNGCKGCRKCKPKPVTTKCPSLKNCKINCKFGFRLDSRGCKICGNCRCFMKNKCMRVKRYCKVGEHHQKQNPETGCWNCPHCIPRPKEIDETDDNDQEDQDDEDEIDDENDENEEEENEPEEEIEEDDEEENEENEDEE